MHFRKATVADSQQIATLHAESWRATYRGMLSNEFLDGQISEERYKVWNKRLTDNPNNQLVLVAEDKSKIVGFICVYLNRDADWGTLIDNLHVTTTQKGKGLGTQLMEEAAKWILENVPNVSVYLWAYEKNTYARNFYTNLKGREVESRPEPAADGNRIMSVRYVWDNPLQLLNSIKEKKSKLPDRTKKELGNKAGDNKIKNGILAGVIFLGFFALYKVFTSEKTSHSPNITPGLRK